MLPYDSIDRGVVVNWELHREKYIKVKSETHFSSIFKERESLGKRKYFNRGQSVSKGD